MKLEHIAGHSGRLSDFLKGELHISTGLMNRLKYQDGLLVNGLPQRTNYPVQPGDRITVLLDEPDPAYPPEEMPLSIVYEDSHLLAVDKPAGMLIHPSRHRDSGTLANGTVWYYRQTGQHCAFHPATRLDRDTFGLVLLAKNAHIHAALNAFHAQGKLEKTYNALVFGSPKEDSGVIEAPIARRPKPSLLRQVHPEGQPSRTEYQVLQRGDGWSRLELRPITGRTHQLRVHCAWMGLPILGDPQYGTEASLAFSREAGYNSQQLCAVSLALPHPMEDRTLLLETKMELTLPK